ncbi:restriction endonuclease subunit S [Epilithonimonas sp.]|uniref:restriction endonuclease subunit S n=1 Tax=Epilithonimonas sp. TaxID=2894511 RepID=UPI002FDD2207
MREDWIEIEFKDVVHKIATSNYKVKQKDYLTAGDFPIIDQGQELIGGYENDEKKVLECALPLVVFGDHTRCVKFINFQFIPGADGIKVLVPKFFINPKYLFYVVNVLANKIENKGYARHYQLLEKQSIALPPLPEQRAIVKKLESLFSSLDAGIADLKKAQQQLKIYRQAVLKKAFEGDLTKTNSDWIIKSFEECTVSFNGKRVPLNRATREKRQGEFRYYGATEIVDYIDDYIFDGEFLLIGEDGANLLSKSKPLAFIVDGKFWVNNHAHIFKPNGDISIKYLNAYFNSLSLNEYVTGTAQPKLTKFNLCKIPVKLPIDISDQLLIVKQIESRLSVCDSIEQNIKESLEKAEALRQSILKKAFEGNLLTAKELAECKLAEDYEPANVLLDRIKIDKKS